MVVKRCTSLPAPLRRALLVAAGGALVPMRSRAQAAACTLVLGHGRFPSPDSAAQNASWDEINRAFATQVAADLAAAGVRTLRMLVPVNFEDVPAIVAALLDNAGREGCDRIVETSMFADDGEQVIVARLRAYPVHTGAQGRRIGEVLHTAQQEFPNTQRNRDRLQPATLARSLAQDYLERLAANRTRP